MTFKYTYQKPDEFKGFSSEERNFVSRGYIDNIKIEQYLFENFRFEDISPDILLEIKEGGNQFNNKDGFHKFEFSNGKQIEFTYSSVD